MLLFLTLTSLILQTSAQCNTCGATSQAACISEDQYFKCVNGIPDFSQILRCPTGSVCRNVAGVCDSTTLTPSCAICGVCTGADGYACLSQTTYSPCSGSTSINWPLNCPPGQICHPTGTNQNPCTTMTWSQTQRCPTGGDPISSTTAASTTVSGSSTTSVGSSTTPSFITNPNYFCRNMRPGYYRNPNDHTCRTYIYCYWSFGMRGMIMTCYRDDIFNPLIRDCVDPGTSGYICPAF